MTDSSFNLPPVTRRQGYSKAAKQLFTEGLNTYLSALRNHNWLNVDDKTLVLIAIHGLTKLGAWQLARCLARLAFAYMTAGELDQIIQDAAHTYSDTTCSVPFE